ALTTRRETQRFFFRRRFAKWRPMSFDVRRWRFTDWMIEDAPDWKGVYVLWSRGGALAVGHASGGEDNIRSRLRAHHSRADSAGMAQVTHYSWEICADPLKREAPRQSETPHTAAWLARESS